MLNSLREHHKKLAETFHELAECRAENGHPVYFVEHGLPNSCLEEVQHALSESLNAYAIDSVLSFDTYLPAIVCATEAGFNYAGNGTDYWPRLQSAVGHWFDFDDRRQLSRWFEKGAERFHGSQPGGSPWERRYCHISWPILHGVAARDIRRPFAESLRYFRGSPADSNASIVAALRDAAPSSGVARYITWLSEETIAAGIVRDLLGEVSLVEAGILSEHFRERLLAGLSSEPAMTRAVRAAKHTQREVKQRAKTTAEKTPTSGQPVGELLMGRYFLRRVADPNSGEIVNSREFELVAQLPPAPREVRQQLWRLRRSKWRPRPWGSVRFPILTRGVLRAQEGTFTVGLRAALANGEDQPFFTGLERLDAPPETLNWLAAVRFPSFLRVPFPPVDPLDETSLAIHGRTPHTGIIWVAHENDELPVEDSVDTGSLAGGAIHQFNAADPLVREWLGWPTTSANGPERVPVRIAAPSPLNVSDGGRPSFGQTDIICLQTLENEPGSLQFRNGEEVQNLTPGVSLVEASASGETGFEITAENAKPLSWQFDVSEFAEPGQTAWEVTLQRADSAGLGPVRRDFLNGRLLLEITSSRNVANLPVRFSVTPGTAVVEHIAAGLPLRITPGHPIWTALKDRLDDSVLCSSCNLELQVSVAGIPAGCWVLEPEIVSLWWQTDSDGRQQAVNDEGAFEVTATDASTGEPVDADASTEEPTLLVALNGDGNTLDFDARIILPQVSHWPSSPEPENLLRQLEDMPATDTSPAGVGLTSLVRRYLQLSSASAASRAADLHRAGRAMQLRNYILDICCGESWSYRRSAEEHALVETESAVAVWWRVQNSPAAVDYDIVLPTRTAEDEPLPEKLSPDMAARFNAALPERWWDGWVPQVFPDDAARLDKLYSELLGGSDVYCDAAGLFKSLQQANQLLCGAYLADLVTPAEGSDEIIEWALDSTTIEELTSLLAQWIVDHLGAGRGRRRWTSDELSDWLCLLLYPSQLRNRPWSALLPKLLNDRPVARAGALIAWRVEQVARIDSMAAVVQSEDANDSAR